METAAFTFSPYPRYSFPKATHYLGITSSKKIDCTSLIFPSMNLKTWLSHMRRSSWCSRHLSLLWKIIRGVVSSSSPKLRLSGYSNLKTAVRSF